MNMVKLTQRDKRTLILGAIVAAVILVWNVAWPWLQEWRRVRDDLAAKRYRLKLIVPGDDVKAAKQMEELARTVPVFEMPRPEKDQTVLFRDRFSEQLKKAGVKLKALEYTGTKSARRVGSYRLLRLEAKGQCQINQAFDLLATLNENPYLVGIEAIQLKCDPRNRQNVDLTLTVSTFVAGTESKSVQETQS